MRKNGMLVELIGWDNVLPPREESFTPTRLRPTQIGPPRSIRCHLNTPAREKKLLPARVLVVFYPAIWVDYSTMRRSRPVEFRLMFPYFYGVPFRSSPTRRIQEYWVHCLWTAPCGLCFCGRLVRPVRHQFFQCPRQFYQLTRPPAQGLRTECEASLKRKVIPYENSAGPSCR